MEKMKVTHVDKNGNIIADISKVKLPHELKKSIFKILNPTMEIECKSGEELQ